MKKIILALMMAFSFAFSSSPPSQYVFTDGNGISTTYYLISIISDTSGQWQGGWAASMPDKMVSIFPSPSVSMWCHSSIWDQQRYGYYYSITQALYSKTPPPPTCPSTQELIDGICVEKCPSGQERIDGTCVNSCNQMLGEFRKSDGTCQDCVPYTNFSSRSFCACDSQGTTYTPQALVTTTQTNGNYSYKKTNITCDNGLRIAIYTEPVNINPQDYNATLNQNGTVSPDTNHTTTPTDTNSTYTPPVQTNNDVVEAIKATTDVSKEIKGEIGKVATDVKAMNEHLAKQGTTFNEVLASIKANGEENKKSNQLLGDVNTGLTQFKNKFGQWVDDTRNDSANEVAAVNGTTNAVNNQGKNITDKLDEVIKAIKEDGNGTSPTDGNDTGKDIDLNETNKKLDTLHDDNNKTHSKLDTLHDDANKTNSTLSDIKSLLDFNGSKYTLDNMLPSGGEGWFTSNALKLNFNTSSANCYCQQAQFTVGGRNFVFPPQDLLDKIPFGIISNLLMAFIYVLGLKNFLKS